MKEYFIRIEILFMRIFVFRIVRYSIGYLTVEAMSAMSGSDSAMRMYSLMANGKNFEDAFENIYEISWNDAKPIFSEYVSSVIEDLFNS